MLNSQTKIKALFFDFDGTIVDSSKSIFASIQYAMQQLNQPPLDEKILATFVGPPLLDSFLRIGLTTNLANEAVLKYREYYQEHMHFVQLYPQMKEVLAQLKDSYQLYIASSKPEVFVKKIACLIDVDQYFTAIYGADLEGKRAKKSQVIAYALSENPNLEPSTIRMVGDRSHDCLGANENKIAAIGVTYGFGSKEELEDAGATEIVTSPAQLLEIL